MWLDQAWLDQAWPDQAWLDHAWLASWRLHLLLLGVHKMGVVMPSAHSFCFVVLLLRKFKFTTTSVLPFPLHERVPGGLSGSSVPPLLYLLQLTSFTRPHRCR